MFEILISNRHSAEDLRWRCLKKQKIKGRQQGKWIFKPIISLPSSLYRIPQYFRGSDMYEEEWTDADA